MTIKIIEIRDRGTRVDVMAIAMCSEIPMQAYYISRSGYPADDSSIMLVRLADGKATNDPHEWPALGAGNRTMGVAHDWIIAHFPDISDGDVVDVEFVLGEVAEPKRPERLTVPWEIANAEAWHV